MPDTYDVFVVGAGNAAFCAALAAVEGGARVLMLERAPEAENGGNSRFTAGAFRTVFYFNHPGGTGLASGAVFGKIGGGSPAADVAARTAA